MTKSDIKRLQKKVDDIQRGFQKVLADHGVRSLRVANFRLADAKSEKVVKAGVTTESKGCWRWICESTPTGPVCHKVWDPNC